MMKQKRIVAVALGLALSVSPMIVLPTAFADQVSGNPSSSISARSTAPNPLDKFSTEEKAFLNNHKDKIASWASTGSTHPPPTITASRNRHSTRSQARSPPRTRDC